MVTKICKQCGIEKPLTEFHESKVHKNGRKPICAKCYNWNHRSEESKQRELDLQSLTEQGLKKCPHCNVIKSVSHYAPNIRRKDGLRAYCKECEQKMSLDRSRRPDIKQKKKERESTPEFSVKLSEYRHNSDAYKKHLIEYRKTEQYKTTQRKTNNRPLRKLRQRISTQIYAKLKLWEKTKQSNFNDYLGCSIESFAHYLESLWVDGMNWGNYGRGCDKWHADHIVPCAYFDLSKEDEIRRCFHYTNYQPLWETDNLRKSSKYNGVLFHHGYKK